MSPNTRKKNSVHEYLAQLVMDYDYRTNDEGVLLASLMIGNDESDISPESKSVSISPEKADTPDKADHDTSPNGTVRYFMQSNAQSHNSAASASVSATHHSTTAATATITGALQHSTTSTSSTSSPKNGLAYISSMYANESNLSAASQSAPNHNAVVEENKEAVEEEAANGIEEEEDHQEEEEEGDVVEEFVSNHSQDAAPPRESTLAKALAAYNRQPEPSAGEVDEALEIE